MNEERNRTWGGELAVAIEREAPRRARCGNGAAARKREPAKGKRCEPAMASRGL